MPGLVVPLDGFVDMLLPSTLAVNVSLVCDTVKVKATVADAPGRVRRLLVSVSGWTCDKGRARREKALQPCSRRAHFWYLVRLTQPRQPWCVGSRCSSSRYALRDDS